MSNTVEVPSTLACAIAVQKELAGGLTWTGSPASPGSSGADGGSTSSFAIAQDGYAANAECTVACSFDYNQCFLPDDYLQAYVGAESATGTDGAEAGRRGAVGVAVDGGSACPDVASVTVTCTYTSAGFCE
jgi:hypothetical protein